MRISLCNEVIAEFPFERQCEFAQKLGYDGLEIAPFTLAPRITDISANRRAVVASRSRKRSASTALSTAI
jgi:D-psicose/D-tagatose/L-ribulose 3-epimerase